MNHGPMGSYDRREQDLIIPTGFQHRSKTCENGNDHTPLRCKLPIDLLIFKSSQVATIRDTGRRSSQWPSRHNLVKQCQDRRGNHRMSVLKKISSSVKDFNTDRTHARTVTITRPLRCKLPIDLLIFKNSQEATIRDTGRQSSQWPHQDDLGKKCHELQADKMQGQK